MEIEGDFVAKNRDWLLTSEPCRDIVNSARTGQSPLFSEHRFVASIIFAFLTQPKQVAVPDEVTFEDSGRQFYR